MPITMIDRNGPPDAMTCPAVICDSCGEPINPVRNNGGLVLWQSNHDDGHRPNVTALTFVHKGRCDREFSQGRRFHSRELPDFMAQLAYNYAHRFPLEAGVEYIAPAPSTWRLGRGAERGSS